MKSIVEVERNLRKIVGDNKVSSKKTIIKYLSGILQENEEILAFAQGTYQKDRVNNKSKRRRSPTTNKNVEIYGYMRMNLITTNKRVIIFNKQLTKVTQIEIPIERLEAINYCKGFLYGEIHISNSNFCISINRILKQFVEPFVNTTNKQMENYKSFKIEVNQTVERDITDKIEKLAELHKEGILTEYEFAIKKMELLEKLKK